VCRWDKTINNTLHRTGEAKGAGIHANGATGHPCAQVRHDRPLVRGKCKRLVLPLLPCTTSVVASAIQRDLPKISLKSAVNRAYQALLRLEAKGWWSGFSLHRCKACPVAGRP
jgi:hypothetical protein